MLKPVVIAVFALAVASPAAAGPLEFAGDGSGTNNPDLLREAVDGMNGACSDCDPGASIVDAYDPLFEVDWRVGLRGAYVQDSMSGDYFEATVAPSVTLSHATARSNLDVTASGELTRSTIEETRIAALRFSVAGDLLIDEATLFNAGVDFSLTRAAPNAPGNSVAVVNSPQVLQGSANASVVRRFGTLEVTLRGNAARVLYGPTTLAGGVPADNSWQNNISGSGALQLGVQVSPVLTVFGEVEGGYAKYDAASPTAGVLFDGPTYEARAGLSARWGGLLAAETSVGVGVRQYDATGIADVQAMLYDASVTFTPDETWIFTGALTTSLNPPSSSGGDGRVTYALNGNARYIVNPWLVLRASASWSRTAVIGTGAVENSYSAGFGGDYSINDNVTFNSDYLFALADTPLRSSHRMTFGLTFAD